VRLNADLCSRSRRYDAVQPRIDHKLAVVLAGMPDKGYEHFSGLGIQSRVLSESRNGFPVALLQGIQNSLLGGVL
jgi:hypothetical protein